jgi:hypothetical protein
MHTDRMRATFTGLERQKADILASVKDWLAGRLAYRPAANEWSAAEVIDHLAKVEQGILAAVRRGVQTPHSVGVADRLRSFLIYLLFRTRAKVRVPRSASEVLPDRRAELEDVVKQWDATRIDLLALLSEVDAATLHAGVFRHPVSGWMTLPQVLRFFSVHMHHHVFQLDRIAVRGERTDARGSSAIDGHPALDSAPSPSVSRSDIPSRRPKCHSVGICRAKLGSA